MPKSPRQRGRTATTKNGGRGGGPLRHDPLGQVMANDHHRQIYAKQPKQKQNNKRRSSTDDDNEGLLDTKASERILRIGKQQQLEIQAEEFMQRKNNATDNENDHRGRKQQFQIDSDEEEEDDDKNLMLNENDDEDDDHNLRLQHDDQGYVTVEDMPGLSAEDEALVASMMGGGGGTKDHDLGDEGENRRQTLADLILEKIQEKETEQQQQQRGDHHNHGEAEGGIIPQQLPAKVVEVYTDIGRILSRYTSGKLPKAFKVIPSLSNWEEVLYLTRPDLWTPQAMYQATRIFASNLNPKMAQRFYNLVLLDAVRNDISYHQKLNYHYYMALKKSVYKPAAFFKGILLPLCSEDCTLREAAIVASVLQRVSIPVHHSAVAIHKLATMTGGDDISAVRYSGATSIFLKTMLNKKYSLPAPVIASLVQYFVRFLDYNNNDTTVAALPVLWHQSLLVFVQRYKLELQENAQTKDALRRLMKKHFHPKITPEIRRELFGLAAYQQERQQITMETGS